MRLAIIRGAYTNPYELQNYELLKQGNEITVFSSYHPLSTDINFPIKKLFSSLDLPDFPYKMPLLNRLFIDGHILFGLESQLKNYDIAYVAETYYGFTQQAIKAKINGDIKKIVSLCWEIIPHNNEGIAGRKKYKESAYQNIDQFICPTRMAKEALIKEGCPDSKIIIIPIGIDITHFKKISIQKDPKKILFVGRFEKEKGVWEILEAFKKFHQDYPSLLLTMCGSGSQKEKMEQWIRENNFTEAIVLTSSEYNDIPNIYQSADMFVLASKPTKYWQEQFGMVLLEAMASGVPIISTTCGAIPEVIGKAGILVRPGDSTAIYNNLKLLMNNYELRKDLSEKGRKRAEEQYDSQKSGIKIRELFSSLQ